MDQHVRYLPGLSTVGLAVMTVITAWLVALGAFGVALFSARDLEPAGLLALVLMGASLQTARAARTSLRSVRRVRGEVADGLLHRKWHGDLATISAEEHRALRPIGMARADAVRRTEDLLRPLTDIPSVRIFRGVVTADLTVPGFAVSAGRLVLIVEPVAWPPGRYLMDATGQIRCDGRFIGQRAGPLATTVATLRRRLPRTHRVRALVAVFPIADGAFTLPVATKDVAWTLGSDLPTTMRTELARHPRTVSRHIIAVLSG